MIFGERRHTSMVLKTYYMLTDPLIARKLGEEGGNLEISI